MLTEPLRHPARLHCMYHHSQHERIWSIGDITQLPSALCSPLKVQCAHHQLCICIFVLDEVHEWRDCHLHSFVRASVCGWGGIQQQTRPTRTRSRVHGLSASTSVEPPPAPWTVRRLSGPIPVLSTAPLWDTRHDLSDGSDLPRFGGFPPREKPRWVPSDNVSMYRLVRLPGCARPNKTELRYH